MKSSEMHKLVDSLAEQRKRHFENIERLTIKDIKELVNFLSINLQ